MSREVLFQDAPRFDRPEPVRADRTECLHLRNYDYREGYDLEVRVTTPDGEVAFEDRFYLMPGRTRSLQEVVDPGEYLVEVRLDDRYETVGACRIDEGPERTALIEVGNGIASVTDGIRE